MSEPLTNATGLVLQVIDALEAFGVQYMLVGSYSSNYYGRPRSTNRHWLDRHGTREVFEALLIAASRER